ncbi:maleylpyruvate isomerase family mycothiol-dependent enzyme [Streptomyces sp. NPDC052225]|uniref:maleylpyruvate isomerase family mycothiol-dependent enzyme n=1 Tax=Streptomyces sp. NPDC052225 TaxID=3154949 RepID=UPI00342FFDEE
MEIAEHIETVDTEGRLLADAAEKAGVDAKVPTCPDWQVRDLLRHQGAVHRWAAAHIAERAAQRLPLTEPSDLDGDELLAWFREGHRHLVDTLTNADPELECWSFMAAPSPLAFWARRQAHETAVHRVDAQSALARTEHVRPDVFPAEFGADGIDELLIGFHARSRSRVRSDVPRVLRVRATDTDAVWTVRVTQEPPATVRGAEGDAECEVSGPASQLYLALWNRLPFPAVTGDASLAALWRERSGI